MYTVFRCSVDESKGNSLLKSVIEEFNEYKSDLFSHKNERNCCNSCSIYEDGAWWDHHGSMIDFMKTYKSIFIKYRGEVFFHFDIALDPEDYERNAVCCYPIEYDLISMLYKYYVTIELSIY